MNRICDRIEEYQDGQLTREQEVEFEKHLAGCSSCSEELAWIKSLDLMFQRAPVRRPPAGLERSVLSALGFGIRPVWACALGWSTISLVGAWLIALPLLARSAGPRSIAPIARGLAAVPSAITAFVNGLQVFVSLLRPAGATAEALAKAVVHTPFPIMILLTLVIGLAAGLGLWRNLREVGYVRVRA